MEHFLFEWVEQPLYSHEVQQKVAYINKLIDFKMNKYQRRNSILRIGHVTLEQHDMMFSGSYSGNRKLREQRYRINNTSQVFHKVRTIFLHQSPCPFIRNKSIYIEMSFPNRGFNVTQQIEESFTYTIETETLDLCITLDKKISSSSCTNIIQ